MMLKEKLISIFKKKRLYGVLCYDNSYNLGDNIQTLSAIQFLPRIDVIIDRDTSILYRTFKSKKKIKVIYNGWFDGNYCKFPPHKCILPLFISFHINEADHSSDSSYDILKNYRICSFKSLVDNEKYFNKQKHRIGCRDQHTLDKLRGNGVKGAYLSGCLTLTLNKNDYMSNETTTHKYVFVVDAHLLLDESDPNSTSNDKLMKSIIPAEVLKDAKYLTQGLSKLYTNDEKTRMAKEFLTTLATQAKLVITSRLHTALPCLAFGIPVIFIHHNLESDIRFPGLIDVLCKRKYSNANAELQNDLLRGEFAFGDFAHIDKIAEYVKVITSEIKKFIR